MYMYNMRLRCPVSWLLLLVCLELVFKADLSDLCGIPRHSKIPSSSSRGLRDADWFVRRLAGLLPTNWGRIAGAQALLRVFCQSDIE